MFIISAICDSVRVPPSAFALPPSVAINSEIDEKYPNKVLYDNGLVISRWGDPIEIGDGICVSDGGAHYEVVFRLLVFRPFVDEVIVGKIAHSSEEGIRVSLGFFNDILIPSYWMLRPSHFDPKTRLWVWTPDYGEEDVASDDNDEQEKINVKQEQEQNNDQDSEEDEAEEARYEMEIGAKIKFKVKSLNFTKVTKSAKGVQATASTISHSTNPNDATNARLRSLSITSDKSDGNVQRRRRSSSLDLTETLDEPPCMEIIASICEDGLGLSSWWEEDDENGSEEE